MSQCPVALPWALEAPRAPRAEPSHSVPLRSAAARPAQDGAERRLLGQPGGLCPHARGPLRTRGAAPAPGRAQQTSVQCPTGPGPEGPGWTGGGGRCRRLSKEAAGSRGAATPAGPCPRAITGRTGPRLCRHGRGGAGRPPQLSLAGPRLGPGGPGTRRVSRAGARPRSGSGEPWEDAGTEGERARPHPAARFLTPWPRPLILISF